MSFGEAISTCFKKYATFSGRASRSEYWWFWLFNFIVSCVAIGIDQAMGAEVVSTIISLGLLLPNLGVAIRRYHDSNHSGWWLLCPIVNIVLLFYASTEGANEYGEPEAA